MKVFLVIAEDRHVDNHYAVRTTLDDAKGAADKFMASYDGHYKWEEGQIRGWHYYCHTEIDDGPSVHIEELEMP